MEAAASGGLAGLHAAKALAGQPIITPPETTAHGALLNYITTADQSIFNLSTRTLDCFRLYRSRFETSKKSVGRFNNEQKKSFKVDDAIRAFVTFLDIERGASRETIRSYHSDLRQFLTFLKNSSLPPVAAPTLASVDVLTIRSYLRWLDEQHEKKSSLARKLSTLKSFFRFLTHEGWTETNPAAQVRSPRQSQRLPKVLTKDEAFTLMEAPKGKTPHDYARSGNP